MTYVLPLSSTILNSKSQKMDKKLSHISLYVTCLDPKYAFHYIIVISRVKLKAG